MGKLRVEWVNLSEVTPYDRNPRKNDAAVEGVAASIREFGWQQPIVVDADGTIIAGHTRYKAAQALGLEQVPIVRATDLTPEQVNAYRLADNKVAEASYWDMDLLGEELDGLTGFDMEQFGFELDGFDTDVEALSAIEEAEPDEDAEDRVKLHELWRCGDHVLLCGDATNAEEAERVIKAAGGAFLCS